MSTSTSYKTTLSSILEAAEKGYGTSSLKDTVLTSDDRKELIAAGFELEEGRVTWVNATQGEGRKAYEACFAHWRKVLGKEVRAVARKGGFTLDISKRNLLGAGHTYFEKLGYEVEVDPVRNIILSLRWKTPTIGDAEELRREAEELSAATERTLDTLGLLRSPTYATDLVKMITVDPRMDPDKIQTVLRETYPHATVKFLTRDKTKAVIHYCPP